MLSGSQLTLKRNSKSTIVHPSESIKMKSLMQDADSDQEDIDDLDSSAQKTNKDESVWMPNFIEIQSDEDEQQIFREIARQNGSRIKKYKKEKSLGILCQQFIYLFVTWSDVISLEGAAQRISMGEMSGPEEKKPKKSSNGANAAKESQKEQKLKTKIRRLYDIANVLNSLGLIKKCKADSKKPAFQWIGLDGTKKAIQEIKELNVHVMDRYEKLMNENGYVENKNSQWNLDDPLLQKNVGNSTENIMT